MKNALVLFLVIFFTANSSSHAFETAAREAILVDMTTGNTLLEKNAEQKMPPSSMSKLMTLYLVFERLKEGSLKLDDRFTVSEKAWAMQGSKMFVPVGGQVAVGDLLQGVIVQSGNDACIVLAEGISGSEDEFASLMNKKAAVIGLKGSHFSNSTGWPDDNHYMTAYDLAVLAKRLIEDFPDYYPYFAQKEFTYNNITQPNRNLLLDKDLGVDGLKTGHAEAAGYGITVSALRDGRRLIGVVNGLSNMQERVAEAEKLLRWGQLNFVNKKVLAVGEVVTPVSVWMGKTEQVKAGIAKDVLITVPRENNDKIMVKALFVSPVVAPVKKGQTVGTVVITLTDGREIRRNLLALEDVEKKGVLSRFVSNLKYAIVPYKPAI